MRPLHTESVTDTKFNMLYSYSYSSHIRYRLSVYLIDKWTKNIRIYGGHKQTFSCE